MFFIKDHLGSVRAVVSETGTVQQTNDYYPFGDLFSAAGTAGSNGNRYRFTGKELGNETGLYDFSARFLQTVLGRFTTIDLWPRSTRTSVRIPTATVIRLILWIRVE